MTALATPAPSVNLTKASHEWATRPDDERFGSVAELTAACQSFKDNSFARDCALSELRVSPTAGDDLLLHSAKGAIPLGNFAFRQLAGRVGAPAGYLTSLPAAIAAQCINASVKARVAKTGDADLSVLCMKRDGIWKARATLTDSYVRIWNADVCAHLQRIQDAGWQVPPARPATAGARGTRVATQADVLASAPMGLSVKVGDLIAPAGLYASDKDMFAFLVDHRHPISNVNGKPMYRGVFIENSEVGDRAFKLTAFIHNTVCGNHIVWDVTGQMEIRIPHIGNADAKATKALLEALSTYAEGGTALVEANIKRAAGVMLGTDKESVVNFLFGKRVCAQGTLQDAWDACVEHPEDGGGSPNTAWGMVQGLTRVSQLSPFTDERTAIDRAAGKIMALVN